MAFACTDALGNRLFFGGSRGTIKLSTPRTRVQSFWVFTLRRVPRDPAKRDDWGFSALFPYVNLEALTPLPSTTEFLPRP
jgi:hypothetical protein